MRLLQMNDNGGFSLTSFLNKDVPEYAILSHTWTDDEVTFRDIMHADYESKKGYRKMLFCGQQAARDGLRYFWLDSCCIDKSSSRELTEAINLMFKYYQRASKCYVHLLDVLYEDVRSNREALCTSRWFTRGWTLQELLAPPVVEFYSVEWIRLGDRSSLELEIHTATGISVEALRGKPLSTFSVQERLSWSEKRITTRAEDAAYCLLGIFAVFMPILYLEGQWNAKRRLLREIMDTNYTLDFSELESLPYFVSGGLDHIDGLRPRETTNHNGYYSRSDDESDVASTIFTAGAESKSSVSSTGFGPVRTSGIREVSRALLEHRELKDLYAIVTQKLERRKGRTHIRGFLKEYGQRLLREAGSPLHIQAAKFVQDSTSRIADEICFSLIGPEDDRIQLGTKAIKMDLESWLSASDSSASIGWEAPKPSDHDMFEGVDSGDDENSIEFPNIELVRHFLLKSAAFRSHVKALRRWLKVDQGSAVKVGQRQPQGEVAGELDETSVRVRAQTRPSSELALEEVVPSPSIQLESRMSSDFMQESAGNQQAVEQHTEDPTIILEPVREDEPRIMRPQRVQESPPFGVEGSRTPCREYNRVQDLLFGLLDYWGAPFLFCGLVEMLMPPVAHGERRIRWRCSCNTVLWADFSTSDEHALDELKRGLARSEGIAPQQKYPSAPAVAASPSSSGSIPSRPTWQTPRSSISLNSQTTLTHPPENQGIPVAIASAAPHVVNVQLSAKFFEVCVNIEHHDVVHHEIDISNVGSDSDLFVLIWDKYNAGRGILRRLFLRPRDVHFVMFSVNRRTSYGAGIHLKPDEFPPQKELDEKRYHYLSPKLKMPASIFLHYLRRARRNVWGEHCDDVWLRRLPKKLEASVLAVAQPNTASAEFPDLSDPDLAFGWGVHILDGPNHGVLGAILGLGIGMALIVSVLVVGLAKTQEQAFGIGGFLLATLTPLMAAVYFKLQDQ